MIKKNKIVSHKYSSKMIDKLKKVASGKKMISPFSYTVSSRIYNTIFQEDFIVLIQQINDDIELEFFGIQGNTRDINKGQVNKKSNTPCTDTVAGCYGIDYF